jgi:hypothetical protein
MTKSESENCFRNYSILDMESYKLETKRHTPAKSDKEFIVRSC